MDRSALSKQKYTLHNYNYSYVFKGTIQWEKVPSASEKNGQSKAWFTVKKDSIHIKTKTFSFWSIFACGGSKKKRATVFFSRPSPSSDLIYLRFYIYGDSEDSKKVGDQKAYNPFYFGYKSSQNRGKGDTQMPSLRVSLSKFEPKPIPNSRQDNITIELYKQFARPYNKCVGIARVLHTSRLSNVLDADCEV